MGPLNLGLAVLAIAAAAAPAVAGPVDRWSAYIAEASSRFGIPQAWIRRVIQAESGGRTTLNGQPITSPAGARGLMQLMPGTWQAMRAAHALGPDPHDPRDNIAAGTAYLRAMYDRFGYPGLFAAYNAGPARYAEHLASGRRLPAETVAYVAAVGGRRSDAPRPAGQAPRGDGIFVALSDVAPDEDGPVATDEASSSLFVRLSGTGPSR